MGREKEERKGREKGREGWEGRKDMSQLYQSV